MRANFNNYGDEATEHIVYLVIHPAVQCCLCVFEWINYIFDKSVCETVENRTISDMRKFFWTDFVAFWTFEFWSKTPKLKSKETAAVALNTRQPHHQSWRARPVLSLNLHDHRINSVFFAPASLNGQIISNNLSRCPMTRVPDNPKGTLKPSSTQGMGKDGSDLCIKKTWTRVWKWI